MILYLITRILIHSWIHVILRLDKLEHCSFLAQKCPIFPILDITKIFLRNLNCHLNHFLIPDIRCNFRNLMNKITKRFKSLDFGHKNAPSAPFWVYKMDFRQNVLKKWTPSLLCAFWNLTSCKYHAKAMNQFRENSLTGGRHLPAQS